ncbi:N-acyl-phosphatidylethanolamine-hydrolyzing phospholipase D [Cyphellophora attinorum]|uniref:N-acyl-phosphatidylethanolamine-hydrolyzing phospholipase D n=1 Tax=Cyphellophora attinorum TaxID=1664694 RepID=A0A0N1H9Q6_9EURO|nr:N-acyl-phosphatidylethanolamine-hydrolyzing phospholipase D [Phialophora attinorum]KPI44355.1 N-acyl-phosphatidylethanolamine-hydrolyzing phospholipase D [Phialophora attinorum]
MRSFLRFLLSRRNSFKPPQQTHYKAMSTSSASALLYAASVASPAVAGTKPDDDFTKNKVWHLKHGGFENPWPSWQAMSGPSIMKAMISRRFSGASNSPDTTPPPNQKLRATWLGHACYYVEFPGGLKVLFDPVFEDRCSPFSWLGPKRYTPPPCEVTDIPTIDAVIISHNHYDHLSLPTVTKISKQYPDVHFFVPLGNKKWFKESNIHNVTELDWWDEVDLTLTPKSGKDRSPSVTSADEPKPEGAITARIGSLPCQHMTARSLTDRCATLWSSWSVTSGGKSIWFGGDTGYRAVPKESDGEDDWSEKWAHLPHNPEFKKIGTMRGPFDLGLIPIGATCLDVLEPPQKLKEALKHHNIPEEGVFDVCNIGESREF